MVKKINGNGKKSYGVDSDDIMDFLKDNMVMREDFEDVKSDVSVLKSDVSTLKTVVLDLDKRLTRVEATMVTKSYLDDKLADLKGDLIEKMRKQESRIKNQYTH